MAGRHGTAEPCCMTQVGYFAGAEHLRRFCCQRGPFTHMPTDLQSPEVSSVWVGIGA